MNWKIAARTAAAHVAIFATVAAQAGPMLPMPAQQASAAPTAHINLRKGDVVPVTFDQDLSVKENRQGDRFSTSVQDSSYLPLGTHLDGYISKLQPKQGESAAFLELAFDQIILPDGSRVRIDAVPMPLDGKYVQKNPDGRYTAKKVATKGSTVAAGALGGLVLGALLKRPFEGAFIGTLAGIVVAESSKDGENLTIKKGTVAGAALQQGTAFDFSLRPGSDPGALPATSFDIRVGTRSLSFSGSEIPFVDGGVTMVPLKAAVTQLGWQFEAIPNAIFVETDDHTLRIENDSANFRYDGRKGTLVRAMVKRNGAVYAPVEVLQRMTNEDVVINGTKLDRPA
jgi:hypothetical protein